MSASSPVDARIAGIFRKTRMLSETPETKTWEVLDDAGRKYLAKMTKRTENGEFSSSYRREYKVFFDLTDGELQYCRVSNYTTPTGFPNVFFAGRADSGYDVIVTELLSPDVFSLRLERRRNENITIPGYLMLAKDMLIAVEKLHLRRFIHRNIKPHNFRIADGFIPFLVNFSDAKQYIHPSTATHYSSGRECSFTGTAKYASINAHRFMVQSRRDDLISLGYSIIDMINKSLPWDCGSAEQQSLDATNHYIQSMKENIPLTLLCDRLPVGIYNYMQIVTVLNFEELPDYNHLKTILEPSWNGFN